MQKKTTKVWRKRGMAIALSMAIIAQSTLTGYAADISIGQEVLVEETQETEEMLEQVESLNEVVILEEEQTENEELAEESESEEIQISDSTSEENDVMVSEQLSTEEAEMALEEIIIEDNDVTVSEKPSTEELNVEESLPVETQDTVVTAQENSTTEEVTAFSETTDFVIDENGILTGYTGTATNVIIPEGVVEIGEEAFNLNSNMEYVEFPSTLKSIGDSAFAFCTSLKEIVLPQSVVSIGDEAFASCTTLEKVILNEGLLYIGDYAFKQVAFGKVNEIAGQTTEYGTLTIPSTVQKIGAGAFGETKYLKEVFFANGENDTLKIEYEDYADGLFLFSESLTKVVLPKRLTTITKEMFWECTKLEEVELGDKVTRIEEYAFENCISLEKVELPEGLLTIDSYAFRNTGWGKKDKSTGKISGGKLTIPSTVTYIGNDAFAETLYLKEITFLNGTNDILEMEDGLEYSEGVFKWSKSLEKVLLPRRLKKVPEGAFYYCEKLKTVYIPGTVEKIERNCVFNDIFEACKKVTIYSEKGSEAEKYAQEKGIAYKDSSALGLFPTSISLSRKVISAVGESAMGKTFTLKATVKPSTAQNKAVTFISQNPQVATVETNGVVTIIGYGETEIKAVSLENEAIFAVCKINVLKTFSEIELDEIRQYIEEQNDFKVITNVYRNLQEVEIKAPEGIEAQWRLPYEIGAGQKRYDVILQKSGYVDATLEDIVVEGICVTGIQLDSAALVEPGQSVEGKVTLLTEGGELGSEDYTISWKSSKDSNVKVEPVVGNPFSAAVTGVKKSSNANVTVKVVLQKDGKDYSAAKADKGITWFETSTKVNVTNYLIVDEIELEAKKDGEKIEISALGDLVNIADKQVITLTAASKRKGEVLENVPLTWKSSNTGVATVKADKNGNVSVTILSKGTSVITATAAKNGGYAKTFRVTVKDSTPRLVEKNISLNLYKKEAAEFVQILPSDNYAVQANSLSVVTAKGEVSSFEINHVGENTYKISVKEGERTNLKTGNHTVKILAKTEAGEEVSHELTLKIKVEKKVPQVTIKQEAIPTYKKDSRGIVWITTDAKISEIHYEAKDKSGARLVEDETIPEEGVLTVKTADVDKDNYTKVKNKGNLTIKFEGYVEEAAYQKAITISIDKKLPVITATPVAATLYPDTLADITEVVFVNKTTGEEIAGNDDYTITAKEVAGYVCKEKADTSIPTIQALKTAKNGKIEYSVSHKDWVEGVTVSSKCSVKVGKVPTLSFENSQVTFNTNYTLEEYDGIVLNGSVKGFDNLKFSMLTVTGKDANAQKTLDEEAISFAVENGQIVGGIADGSYFSKAGNYTYNITAYTDSMPVSGTLKVAVTKSAPTVSFKTKGKIDLLDRTGTELVATPTIKNCTGKVVDVNLYSAYADKFEAKVENGNILIQAQEQENLKTKTNYTLHMYLELESGVRLPATVKVTPTQSKPKLVQNAKQVVLFETAKGISYGEEFTVSVAEGQKGTIDKIRLVADNDTFSYNGTTVYVKDTASLKPGKSYTLKFEVIFEEAGTNEKPVTVSLKVDYRK